MIKITSNLILASLVFFLFGLVVQATPVQAQDYQLGNFAKVADYNTGSKASSVEGIAQKILNITLSLMGLLFIGFAIFAGMRWMTAQGNEDHVTTAKNTLEAAIIGLVVVAMSFAITNLIFSKISGAAPAGNDPQTEPLNAENGEKCTSNDDCKDGVCGVSKVCESPCVDDEDCVDNANGPICNANKQCAPLVEGKNADGGACADNTNCNDGLFCIQNVCKAAGALGDDCDPPSCASGLVCNEDKKCSSPYSVMSDEGGSCASVACAGGMKCSEGKICLKVVGKGQNCIQSEAGYPVFCQGGLICGVDAVCDDPKSDPVVQCFDNGGTWQGNKCVSAQKIDQCINTKLECESTCLQTKDTCETQCTDSTNQCNISNCDNPYQTCQANCTPAVCISQKGCDAMATKEKSTCNAECKVNYPNYCSTDCYNIQQTCHDNCNTQNACKSSCTSDFNFCSSQAQCEKSYQECLST